MTKKILIIEACIECKHCTKVFPFYCYLTSKYIPYINNKSHEWTIPTWCELDDAPIPPMHVSRKVIENETS